MVSSCFTNQYLTLSVLMVVRNLGPLITLPMEIMVMSEDKKPAVTCMMIMALMIILASTFAYSNTIQVSEFGRALAALSIILTVADRIAQRRLLTTECKNLSLETCMFINNFVGFFPTMFLALCLGEIGQVNVKMWFTGWSVVLLLLSGILATGMCYFALAVQREITAVSFMVLQNLVRVAVVFVGVLVFSHPIGWPWQGVGLTLSFVGASLYGWALIEGAYQRQRKELRKQVDAAFEQKRKEVGKQEEAVKEEAPITPQETSREGCPK